MAMKRPAATRHCPCCVCRPATFPGHRHRVFSSRSRARHRRVAGEGEHAAYGHGMARFVALGDSLTEGVGDAHAGYPNGWRGWADLLAEHLARLDPTIEYANLALRAKRVRHVLDEQVGDAVAMDPSIVSLWAGGNDILLPRGSVAEVAGAVDESVDRLAATGAAVLLFTGFELAHSSRPIACTPRPWAIICSPAACVTSSACRPCGSRTSACDRKSRGVGRGGVTSMSGGGTPCCRNCTDGPPRRRSRRPPCPSGPSSCVQRRGRWTRA